MKRWLAYALGALAMVGILAIPARAQMTYASSAQFASLQNRIDELEAQLASIRSAAGGGCCDSASCDGSCDSCAWPCYTPGLVFGAELTFLRPFQSEGQMVGFDYKAAPRIWLGWQNANGFGIRGRWFEYDGGGAAAGSLYQDVDTYLIDIEATDTFRLGHKWSGLFSAGLRFAQYRETNNGGGVLETDSAIGPVVGVELYRPIACNWYVLGIGRTSFLFTDATQDILTLREDTTFSVSELQLGVEYRRDLGGTAALFARAMVEAQYWSAVSDGDSEDVSFFGGGFALGITR